MKKAGGGGGFKRSSFSKPSSSPKRPSPFKSGFKIGRKAPGMEGGPKDAGGFAEPGQRYGGWRSRPRGGCLGGLVGLVLVLICIGVIVGALLFTGTLQALFGG